MSDLHWALIGLALFVLAALYAYGKLQERRARAQLEAGFAGEIDATLLEPAPAPAPTPAHARVEPSFGSLDDAVAPAGGDGRAVPMLEKDSDWVEDPLLDCVLELRCTHAVDGVSVIDASMQLQRLELGQPVRLAAWDGRTQRWVEPDRFGFYTEVLLGTQLAHRKRCLGDLEVARFIAAGQQLAVALDADFDPPDASQVVAQASRLAAQIAEFDVVVGLTVRFDSPVERTRVAAALQQAGFSASDETWTWQDDAGRRLFTAATTADPADSVTLEMDVPLAPATEQPFRTMLETANRLAAVLGGAVVDDNGRPVGTASADAIDVRLRELCERMRAVGIDAGELRARRLFA
jgi:hypothetical protein